MKLTIAHGGAKRKLMPDLKAQFTTAQVKSLVQGAQKHLAETLETPAQKAWLDAPIDERKHA